MSTPARDQGSAQPILVADRLAITVAIFLLTAAAISWVAAYHLMPVVRSSDVMAMGVASIVSSLSITSVGMFEFIWVVGTVAMMFPAMLPVVLFYDRMVAKAESNLRTAQVACTPLFILGYLAMYAALGLVAYVSIFFALGLGSTVPAIAALSAIGPGLVLCVAGIYQLTPLKTRCLSNCVSPLGFFLLHSRRGLSGALGNGAAHGAYCVGCCWAYMLVMFAVAAMSIPFMAIIAAVITFEKVIVRGAGWFTRTIASVFLILGVGSFFFPEILGLFPAGT